MLSLHDFRGTGPTLGDAIQDWVATARQAGHEAEVVLIAKEARGPLAALVGIGERDTIALITEPVQGNGIPAAAVTVRQATLDELRQAAVDCLALPPELLAF